jgi:hypothetical protein
VIRFVTAKLKQVEDCYPPFAELDQEGGTSRIARTTTDAAMTMLALHPHRSFAHSALVIFKMGKDAPLSEERLKENGEQSPRLPDLPSKQLDAEP